MARASCAARRSRRYFFFGAAGFAGAIIFFDVSTIITCLDVSTIIIFEVSDIIIILEVSAAAGFSPFEHPAMATTATTNAMRFMRAPS
jgi:hypothetical protein